jgi:hypothetical protein
MDYKRTPRVPPRKPLRAVRRPSAEPTPYDHALELLSQHPDGITADEFAVALWPTEKHAAIKRIAANGLLGRLRRRKLVESFVTQRERPTVLFRLTRMGRRRVA